MYRNLDWTAKKRNGSIKAEFWVSLFCALHTDPEGCGGFRDEKLKLNKILRSLSKLRQGSAH